MFRASHDHSKTFGPKINLSNTPNSNSVDTQVAAEGSNRFFNPLQVCYLSNSHFFLTCYTYSSISNYFQLLVCAVQTSNLFGSIFCSTNSTGKMVINFLIYLVITQYMHEDKSILLTVNDDQV